MSSKVPHTRAWNCAGSRRRERRDPHRPGHRAGKIRDRLDRGPHSSSPRRRRKPVRAGVNRARSIFRCAVSWARPRSLDISTSQGSSARRAAMASACAMPSSVRLLSPWPWIFIATFQSVWPWRTTTMRVISRPCRSRGLGGNRCHATHERNKRLRHSHRSVGVLVVLEDRDERASDGESRSVDRMQRLDLALVVPVSRHHPARLEALEVRAGRDLAIGVLPGKPHLDVVRLRRREARVARAEQHGAVRQLELPQDRLGVRGERLVGRGGILGLHDLHDLHLVELVHADDAARVLAVAAGFGTEARAVRGVAQRQVLRIDDRIPHEVRDGILRGRDEVEVAPLDLEEVVLELRERRDAVGAVGGDHVRDIHLGITVLLGVHREHELPERAMQPGDSALEDVEARARELRSGLEVEAAQRLAHVHVVLRLEVERARRAPAAHLDVLVARTTLGHVGLRDVRDHAQEGRLPFLDGGERHLVGLQLVADAGDFRHHGRGILALALEHPDLLRERVALALELLGAGLDLLAFVLEGEPRGLVEDEAAAFQARDGGGKVLAKQLDVEHAVILASPGYFAPRGSACTASSAFCTLASGDIPPTVAATLPSGDTMNVVRSANPWSMSTPRVSLRPARPSFTERSYDFAMWPSASEATGNLLLQYSGSFEKSFRRAMLSSDTPMMLAPAAANLSWFSANAWAWTLHPLV